MSTLLAAPSSSSPRKVGGGSPAIRRRRNSSDRGGNMGKNLIIPSRSRDEEEEEQRTQTTTTMEEDTSILSSVILPLEEDNDATKVGDPLRLSSNNNESKHEMNQKDDEASRRKNCPICLEDFQGENAITNIDIEAQQQPQEHQQVAVVVEACGHAFCRACLQQHCRYEIATTSIHSNSTTNSNSSIHVQCPHAPDCDAHLSHDNVANALLVCNKDDTNSTDANNNNEDWIKFQKLVRLSQDSQLRECPGCQELVRVVGGEDEDDGTSATSNNDVTCPLCAHAFCLVHGNAHTGLNCADYASTEAAQLVAATERALQHNGTVRPCSHCGAYLQKSHGCDHIVCGHCHSDMCWKCGTHIHLKGNHMVRHCTNCKRDYRDHRYDRVYRTRLCLCLPFLLPLIILYVVLAATAAVLTGCFCGCFKCGQCLDYSSSSSSSTSTSTNKNDGEDDDDGTALNEQHQPQQDKKQEDKKRGTARHGICAGTIVIFLPFIVLLEDFGIHLRILDELFPEPDNELPFLQPSGSSDAATTTTPPQTATADESV